MSSYVLALITDSSDRFLIIKEVGQECWQLPSCKNNVIGDNSGSAITDIERYLNGRLGEELVRGFKRKSNIPLEGEGIPYNTFIVPYQLEEEDRQVVSGKLSELNQSNKLGEFKWVSFEEINQLAWKKEQSFVLDDVPTETPNKVLNPVPSSEDKIVEFTISELESKIQNNKASDTLKLILKWIETGPDQREKKYLKYEVISLLCRFSFVKQRERRGVLSSEQKNVAINRLNSSATELLDGIKENHLSESSILQINLEREPDSVEAKIISSNLDFAISILEDLHRNDNNQLTVIQSELNRWKTTNISGELEWSEWYRWYCQIVDRVLTFLDAKEDGASDYIIQNNLH